MRLKEFKETKQLSPTEKQIVKLQKESAEIYKKIEALRNKKAP